MIKCLIAWTLVKHAKVADGSAVKGALAYFLERWKELQIYLKYPKMPFTSNDCERQIREMVLAARRAAMMYSFFGNASYRERIRSSG